MADKDTVTLAIPIDQSLHARLKIGAAMVGASSMKAYVIALLEMGTPDITPGGGAAMFGDVNTVKAIQAYLNDDPGGDE